MRIETHRLAEREIDEAEDYFSLHGMKPSGEFVREVKNVYRTILVNPGIGSPIYRNYRFMKLQTYSYTVFYRQISPDLITVYAVAYDSRRPGYWRWRTRNS